MQLPQRALPQDLEAERAVLGSMLLAPDGLELARDRLGADDFYKIGHQDIFTAMLDVFDDKGTLDIVLLRQELDKRGKLDKAGGKAYLVQLEECVPSAANAEFYIEVVREQAERRDILSLDEHVKEAYEPGSEVLEIVARIRAHMDRAREGAETVTDTAEHLREATSYLERRSKGELPFIETGIGPIDRILHGLQPGMLTMLGGRPGDGKTSLAANILAYACIGGGHATLFFSAEMPGYQIIINLQRILTQIDYSEVARGMFSATNRLKWNDALKRIRDRVAAGIFTLDDTGGVRMSVIKARTNAAVRHKRIELLIVDYIQLVRGDRSAKRNLEVANITQELKALAQIHKIHVLVLSQITRADKDDPTPKLKWSGEQEEAADIVMLLGRKREYITGKEEEPVVAERSLWVAKNRHGRVGKVYLTFDKPVLTFRERTKEGDDAGTGDAGPDAGGGKPAAGGGEQERATVDHQGSLGREQAASGRDGRAEGGKHEVPSDDWRPGDGDYQPGQGNGGGGDAPDRSADARQGTEGANQAPAEREGQEIPEGEFPA